MTEYKIYQIISIAFVWIRFYFSLQIAISDNIDMVIFVALLPVASLSARIFAAKKYVLSSVSTKPINHPFTSCPSIRPVPFSVECSGIRGRKADGVFYGINVSEEKPKLLLCSFVKSSTCSIGEIFSEDSIQYVDISPLMFSFPYPIF